jgi:hypothetical protein
MRISMEIPDTLVSVADVTNHKGNPESIIAVLGIPLLYFNGAGERKYNEANPEYDWRRDNSDWEEHVKYVLARTITKLLLADETIADNFQLEPVCGREISYNPSIEYVREDNN